MPRYLVTIAGDKKTVDIEDKDGIVRAVIDGQERTIEVRGTGRRLHWLDGDRVVAVDVDGAAPKLTVTTAGHTLPVEVAPMRLDAGAEAGREARVGPVSLRAPMPGRVVKVLVKVGDQVKVGQGVLVVEAMKMENELKAPRDGQVKEIAVAEGAAVEAGEALAKIE
jgi:biotin carboxyl carrier protein